MSAGQIVNDGVHHVILDPESPLKLLILKPRNFANPVVNATQFCFLMIILNERPLLLMYIISTLAMMMLSCQLSMFVLTKGGS